MLVGYYWKFLRITFPVGLFGDPKQSSLSFEDDHHFILLGSLFNIITLINKNTSESAGTTNLCRQLILAKYSSQLHAIRGNFTLPFNLSTYHSVRCCRSNFTKQSSN